MVFLLSCSTKRTSQGEQIALLCKTLKASVLYTERQSCRNSKVSVSRRDRFSLLRQKEEEELGEEILPGQPIQSTPPPALPLYSFEWGTPLHFSSLLRGVCVETELESVCVCGEGSGRVVMS